MDYSNDIHHLTVNEWRVVRNLSRVSVIWNHQKEIRPVSCYRQPVIKTQMLHLFLSLSLTLSLFSVCLLFKCVRLHDVYRKLVNNKRKKRKIFWKYDEDKCVKWPWTLDNEWHNFRLLKVRLLLLDNSCNLIRSEMGKSKLKLRRVEEVIFIIIIFCKIRRKSQRVLRKENGFE